MTDRPADALMVSSLLDVLRANPHGLDLGELASSFSESPERMRGLIDYVWSLEITDASGQVDPSQMFDFDADGLDEDEPWVKLTHDPVRPVARNFDANELALVLTGLEVLREAAGVADAARIDALHAKLRGATGPEAANRGDARVDALGAAITARQRVRITYSAEQSEAPVEREVDPLRLEARNGFVYLNAYCHLRHDLRWFRADRILELERLETPAEPHSAADRDRGLVVTGRGLIPVDVAVGPGAVAAVRPYLAGRSLPAAGKIRLRLKLRSAGVAARLAAEHAGEFVVEGPTAVREHVMTWLEGALARQRDGADRLD
jgi:proteasome accessory factor C